MSSVPDWEAYFRQLRADKDAEVRGEEELVAPEPEHTSRDPWPEGFTLPGPAKSLKELAEGAGWLARTQYARATVVCRRKQPSGGMKRVLERRHSVGVVLWHPGRSERATAVWEAPADAKKLSWGVETVRAWRVGELPRPVTLEALKERIREEGR